MEDLKRDPEELIRLLIVGEVLTRRGETGPLARLWVPSAKKRAMESKKRGEPDPGTR